MKKNKFFLLVLVILCFAFSAVGVSADSSQQVIFNDDFTLEKHQEFIGDLVVIGGNIELEQDSTLKGDVVSIGGSMTAAGTIDGDLTCFGGNVELKDTAVIEGSLTSFGGNVDKSSQAVVLDNSLQNSTKILDKQQDIEEIVGKDFSPNGYRHGFWGTIKNFFNGTVLLIIQILAMSAFAVLAMLLIGPEVKTCGSVLQRYPLQSLGIGLLTVILVPFAAVALCMTVILIPLAIVLLLLLLLVFLYGWIIIGNVVGTELVKLIRVKWADIWVTAFGTFVICLFVDLFGKIIPCFGWMPYIFLSLFGIGAVIIKYTKICGGKGQKKESVQLPPRGIAPQECDATAPQKTAMVMKDQLTPVVKSAAAPQASAPVVSPSNAVIDAEAVEPVAAPAPEESIPEEPEVMTPAEVHKEDSSVQNVTEDHGSECVSESVEERSNSVKPEESEPAAEPEKTEEPAAVEEKKKKSTAKGISSSLIDSLQDDIEGKK